MLSAALLAFLVLLSLFLFLLLLLARRTSRTAAGGPQACSMATAATVSTPEGEESSAPVNVEEHEETREREPGKSEGWTVPRFNHPVYKKLSSLNGELNALSLSKLKEKLTSLNLSAMYVAGWGGGAPPPHSI